MSQISYWKDAQWLLEVTYHRGGANPGFFLGGGAPLKGTTIFMVFFGLSWLSINIKLGNEPCNSKMFWRLTFQESMRNHLPTRESVRWVVKS